MNLKNKILVSVWAVLAVANIAKASAVTVSAVSGSSWVNRCSNVDTVDQAIEQHLNNKYLNRWGSFNVVSSNGNRYLADVFLDKNFVNKSIEIIRDGKKYHCTNAKRGYK